MIVVKEILIIMWKRGVFGERMRDLVLSKVFNDNLAGAIGILKFGAKLHRLLFDLIYKSNHESLFYLAGIGDSKPGIVSLPLGGKP